ncbi:MAG: HDIG domain-containing protein [Spirochaetes bacterium]|nr:HDIG domain-containing protein [Spirochaetota bacterium]
MPIAEMKKFKLSAFFNAIIHNKDNLFYKSLLTLLLFVVVLFVILGQYVFRKTVTIPKINSVLTKDIEADREVRYLDKDETKRNEEVIRLSTPAIFIHNEEISANMIQVVRTVLVLISQIEKYQDFTLQIKDKNVELSEQQFQILKQIISNDPGFIDQYLTFLFSVYRRGTIKLAENIVSQIELSGIIIGRYQHDKLIETRYSPDEIYDMEVTKEGNKLLVFDQFSQLNKLEKEVLLNFYNKTVITNIIYDEELSEMRLNNKLKNQYVYRKILKGEIVAERGERVTPENIDQIVAVLTSKTNKLEKSSFLAYLMILLILFILAYLFLKLNDKNYFVDLKNLIFLIIIVLMYSLNISMPIYLGLEKTNYFYGFMIILPAITLTFIFLYTKAIAAMITAVFSIAFFVVSDFNHIAFLYILLSSLSVFFTITEVKRRIDLLLAGLLMIAINLILAVFLVQITDFITQVHLYYFFIFAALNGFFSAILSIGVIALGEIILNSPSIFRLQELSDASAPVLKELFDTAVGTYNHSILVANLAEAAAIEIGADGVLARVGGYYHDIGKMDNPEYFIENQGEFNIHNQLKPSISVTIIKNHVKKGVERAKKERLPQKIIDIIAQHHGNSLIKFFYAEALKSNDANKQEIQKDLYHYKGENPQFPESAIVLLADQVEAASRTLKKPTMSNVDKLIEAIFSERFQEGSLDDSGLTLKDLTKIRKIFVKLLLGMYHSRIEYPQAEKK